MLSQRLRDVGTGRLPSLGKCSARERRLISLAASRPRSFIRLMGRWSSDVYEIYCRMSVEAALQVGTALSSATVTIAGSAKTW